MTPNADSIDDTLEQPLSQAEQIRRDEIDRIEELAQAEQARRRALFPRRPLTSDEIDELFASARISSISPSWQREPVQKDELSIFIGVEPYNKMRETAQVRIEHVSDTVRENRFVHIYVKSTALKERIAEHGMIYGTEGTLSDHYTLEILENKRLYCRYQSIIGSRHFGDVTEEQLQCLSDHCAQLIAERTAQHAVKLVSKAKAVFSPSAVKGLESELGLLSVDGQRVNLPATQLKHYASIKDLMLKAGATYGSDKRGSHFNFPVGIDVAEVMSSLNNGQKVNVKQETQFFGTPPEVAKDLVAKAGSLSGKRVLEPSAGEGALVDAALRAGASEVVAIENWPVNVNVLKSKGMNPMDRDFLSVKSEDLGLFDAVIMNPPFKNRQDLAHIRHALSFVEPDGIIAAILSPSHQTSTNKDARNFAELLDLAQAEVTTIDAGAFKSSGTSVSTLMLRMEMPKLMAALKDKGTMGEEYGLNLRNAWQGLARQQTPRP